MHIEIKGQMRIRVNGQDYGRWEDLPDEVRGHLVATLPDADKNGIPDLFEGDLSGLPVDQTTTSVTVNGQKVDSADQLPPEVQQVLRQAFTRPDTGPPAAPGAGTAPVLQPDQVMLNGVPTTVGAEPARKPRWRRLFGG
jgi:hypothetical protein